MLSQKITDLIDSYLDGESSPAAIEQLRLWLDESDANVDLFADQVFLHRQLRETLVAERAASLLDEETPPAAVPAPLNLGDESSALGGSWTSMPSVLFLLLLVAALTGFAAFQLGRNSALKQGERAEPALIADVPSPASPMTTLVNVTNCRWDKSRTTADFDKGLRPGQSLHLLEGVAEIDSILPSGGRGTFQLEGPLAMMLSSEGMPSLLYGKLAGIFTNDYDQFSLDTPLGRVIVPGDASIGVVAAANEVEVHAFSGEAIFELWSNGANALPEQLKVASGTSLRMKVDGNRRLATDRGDARENWFVTPSAIAASQLSISKKYVSAIREAKPIGYWRFESIDQGSIRNEMADRIHCRVVGDAVRLNAGRNGNHTGEFGLTSGPGYLFSEDSLDGEFGECYTVEVWVKPTYYHHGALFSLINWSPEASISPHNRHRLHVELCGPGAGYNNYVRPPDEHPGRIRLMSRRSSGKWEECFSSSPYLLRKWQHLATVKDGSRLRLYADGELVAESEGGPHLLGTGLRVLMGQLYPRSEHIRDEVTSRLFVGEMDEVALYNRALSEKEIKQHIEMTKPRSR